MQDVQRTEILELTIGNASTSTTTVTDCDSNTWNDSTYTTSGTYTWSTTNAVGCDSTVTLNLTINNSTTSSVSEIACDDYSWNGITYASSGTYTWSGTNAAACDSTATLNLTINNNNGSVDVITSCNEYTWIDSISYTSSNNSASIVYSDVNGCDSVVSLYLTIFNYSTSTDSVTSCDSYTWNGTIYDTSGVYTDTILNLVGCDSIMTLSLTIDYSSYYSQNIIICEGESYVFGSNVYTTPGIFTDTLQNIAGCDSIIITSLTVLPVDQYS